MEVTPESRTPAEFRPPSTVYQSEVKVQPPVALVGGTLAKASAVELLMSDTDLNEQDEFNHHSIALIDQHAPP